MAENIADRIENNLPKFVKENLYADHTFEAIEKISRKYLKENDPDANMKMQRLKNVLGLVSLKDVRIENLAGEIGKRLEIEESDAKAVALILLREVFYPIKNYFPGIGDEIIKLGGELPKSNPKIINEQLLKRDEEIEQMQAEEEKKKRKEMADMIVNSDIESLMFKFPEAGEQIIGSQDSIEVRTMPVKMKPMIKYWIQDYKDKMGYYQHSNLERVQYVCHDTNTRNMNAEERRQLNLILKSCDDKTPLPYSTKWKRIDFPLIEEK